MNIYWKIMVIVTVPVAAGILAALALAQQVQRTIFRISEPAGLEQALAEDFRNIDGVQGLRLEAETGKLVVDHCPELEQNQLLQVVSVRDRGAEVMSSERIHAIRACTFPTAVDPGSGRACRQGGLCAAGASWRELLAKWRGGD